MDRPKVCNFVFYLYNLRLVASKAWN
jgi:hypothetical protein